MCLLTAQCPRLRAVTVMSALPAMYSSIVTLQPLFCACSLFFGTLRILDVCARIHGLVPPALRRVLCDCVRRRLPPVAVYGIGNSNFLMIYEFSANSIHYRLF